MVRESTRIMCGLERYAPRLGVTGLWLMAEEEPGACAQSRRGQRRALGALK